MTENKAYDKARTLSKQNDCDMYVVFEDGEYGVTDELGLDSYWLGARIEAWYFGGEIQE